MKNNTFTTTESCSQHACRPLDLGVIETASATEIERRVHAHDRGEGDLFDVEAVMVEAKEIAP